jgi:hypothetical protein
MAALMHAIPFISSYIIIASVTQGASIISAGINRTLTGRFGMGGGMATAAQLSESQFRIDQFRADQEEQKFAAAQQIVNGNGSQQASTTHIAGPDPTLQDKSQLAMWGMSPQDYTRYSQILSGVSGAASGFNWTDGFMPGILSRGGIFSSAIKAAATGTGIITDEARNAIMDVADAQYRTAATWEQYHLAKTAGQQNTARRMMYGQLPVMDTSESPYPKEWQSELERYEKAFGLAAAGTTAIGESTSYFLGGIAGPGSNTLTRRIADTGFTLGGVSAIWTWLMSGDMKKKEVAKPEK